EWIAGVKQDDRDAPNRWILEDRSQMQRVCLAQVEVRVPKTGVKLHRSPVPRGFLQGGVNDPIVQRLPCQPNALAVAHALPQREKISRGGSGVRGHDREAGPVGHDRLQPNDLARKAAQSDSEPLLELGPARRLAD